MIIAICDSDKKIAETVHCKINMYFSQHIVKNSCVEPIKIILLDNPAQCEWMDLLIINTGTLNHKGIVLAEKYKKNHPSCAVIFYSENIEDSLKVYDVEHLDFILLSKADYYIKRALERALSVYEKLQEHTLKVKIRNEVHKIYTDNILYIEVNGRYVNIHTEQKQYTCIKRLKDIADMLPANFIRSHNSYLVNIDKISIVKNDMCVLQGEHCIPISYTYRKKFLNMLENLGI